MHNLHVHLYSFKKINILLHFDSFIIKLYGMFCDILYVQKT